MGRLSERAKRLKNDIPAVMLCLKSPETPKAAKIAAGITIAYALSPIDLIPDFIPVLGYLDDIIILPALIALTIRLVPREVFERCSAEAREMRNDTKKKKWYFAIPIIIFYLLIFIIILKLIFF